MPDIVTSKVFVDGEKGITAAKLNQIISGAVIQPSFVSGKPASSTLDPTDQLLEVKGTGSYATITGSQLISSVSAQVDATPQIYSARLRSFNALQNSTMEVDQRNTGTSVTLGAGTFVIDRWQGSRTGTSAVSAAQVDLAASGVQFDCVPGTNFRITSKRLRFQLQTQQTTLGAGDFICASQLVEGPRWRELSNDVHSISLLVSSTVAPLKFSVSLRDQNGTHSLVKLCSIPAGQANILQLITLPNLPKWSASGVHSVAPGANSYNLSITLAAGSNFIAPAADTWQNGSFLAAPGIDNWAASAVNSQFDVSYISHEPGSQCSNPPMDCPFTQNYDDCLRYYCKSYDYGVKAGANTTWTAPFFIVPSTNNVASGVAPFPKPMAKSPSCVIYATNGAANAATLYSAGTNVTISSVTNNTALINALSFAANQTAGTGIAFHYTADTGW